MINCNLAKSSVNNSGIKSAYASLVQAKANLESFEESLGAHGVDGQGADWTRRRWSATEPGRTIENAKIVAPFDGLVTTVDPIVGGPGSGSTTISLADISQYHVDVLIDETEIAQVKAGQKVKITFDALTGADRDGRGGAHRSGRHGEQWRGELHRPRQSRPD